MQEAYAAVTPRDRAASFGSRWRVWASAYGGNARTDGDTGAGSHTIASRAYGLVGGAGYQFTPATQIGFAIGGAGSSFSLDSALGGGRADIFHAALYGRHELGETYVAGLVGYAWQDAATDRTVTVSGTDTLHASFHPQALSTRVETGRRFAMANFGVSPYAALQAATFFIPAYGETATSGSSQFALNYGSATVTATRGELGVRWDREVIVEGGVLTAKAKTAWAHDGNRARTATATFQTLPGATFVVAGAAPSADAVVVSLGAKMAWSQGWSIAASFDSEYSGNSRSYAGKGAIGYTW